MGEKFNLTNELEYLEYLDPNIYQQIIKKKLSDNQKFKILSLILRFNILYMIKKAGSGHIGTSFSSIDFMLYFFMHLNPQKNIFFSSKGHDSPALYNTMIAFKQLNKKFLHSLRRIDGLPGHPDISISKIITNTGSLGMGISKAKGMILADRINKIKRKYFVMLGDGELQEGQIWESSINVGKENFPELYILIDNNKIQSDTYVKNVSDIGDLKKKFVSFGYHYEECDGNSFSSIKKVFQKLNKINKPKVICLNTIKGSGVSFMEAPSKITNNYIYKYHSGAPSDNDYIKAIEEIKRKIFKSFKDINLKKFLKKTENQKKTIDLKTYSNHIKNYSSLILSLAQKNKKIVCLDADLLTDNGLLEFKTKFRKRFFELGIAEQDMVSTAGGMALNGLIPIVHSFSCFLSTRPNEQIFNNSSEKTKIIYFGSLSGLVPSGPGHSHQSLRDISSLGGIPDLIIFEPMNKNDLKFILNWSVYKNKYSTFIRINSLNYLKSLDKYKSNFKEKGHGELITGSGDIIIITYGPIMIDLAIKINAKLFDIKIKSKVINMPWLNYVDDKWLKKILKNSKMIVCIDNHFENGGLSNILSDKLTSIGSKKNLVYLKTSVKGFPKSGTNDEVMGHHGFTVNKIFNKILSKI